MHSMLGRVTEIYPDADKRRASVISQNIQRDVQKTRKWALPCSNRERLINNGDGTIDA